MRGPEAEVWLALYDEARAALDDAAWHHAVPAPSDVAPMIDGALIDLDPRAPSRLIRALLRRARAPVTDVDDDDGLALLAASLADDGNAVHAIAERSGLTPGMASAIAALATLPLLQACRAAWSARISRAWIEAACPICGAWAALVEARGLERALRHRCARCGADWNAQPVRCGFCGNAAHTTLTSLVSERASERARVEACEACRGYLKTVTTLTACPPDEVALLDLDTVPLDIVAIEHGFARPAPKSRAVTVNATPRSRMTRMVARLGGRR